MKFANAGHPRQILVRAGGGTELIGANGFFVGMFEPTEYEERSLELKPGDRLINYTDGIPEAMSPKNEEFGEERFYKLVEKTTDKTCNQFCSILVQAIEKWAAGGEQHDDITIVALSVS